MSGARLREKRAIRVRACARPELSAAWRCSCTRSSFHCRPTTRSKTAISICQTVGQITVTLRVRYVDDVQASNDGVRRCGCEFVELSESAARMLQRYMNKLDAAARSNGPPPDEVAA
jgi:hypothetical protein